MNSEEMARSEQDIPGIRGFEEEQYPYIKVIENGYVASKRYCGKCGSIDVGVSKKGNLYCKKLCRKK